MKKRNVIFTVFVALVAILLASCDGVELKEEIDEADAREALAKAEKSAAATSNSSAANRPNATKSSSAEGGDRIAVQDISYEISPGKALYLAASNSVWSDVEDFRYTMSAQIEGEDLIIFVITTDGDGNLERLLRYSNDGYEGDTEEADLNPAELQPSDSYAGYLFAVRSGDGGRLRGTHYAERKEGGEKDDGLLSFPLASGPYTTPVESIHDHSGNFYRKDGVVEAFNGVRAVRENGVSYYGGSESIRGYRNEETDESGNPRRFTSSTFPFPYEDDEYLWYDGHPGYDYEADTYDDISPPAPGRLCISTNRTRKGSQLWRDPDYCPTGNDPVNGKNGEASSWNGWHTFYIVHDGGHQTWYLHARGLAEDVRDEIQENGYATIDQDDVADKETIADVGGWGGVGPHLHFEVRLDGELIDPYEADLWE